MLKDLKETVPDPKIRKMLDHVIWYFENQVFDRDSLKEDVLRELQP